MGPDGKYSYIPSTVPYITPTPTATPSSTITPTPTITPMPTQYPICINSCGNGICEEIVCQGVGCPCVETLTSCPRDCSTTTITVYAAGSPAKNIYPNMELRLNGRTLKTWTSIKGNPVLKKYLKFTYVLNQSIGSQDKLRIYFTNAEKISGLSSRKLRVDKITLDTRTIQTEKSTTYSTGTYNSTTNKCASGYPSLEWLNCNGYFQFKL